MIGWITGRGFSQRMFAKMLHRRFFGPGPPAFAEGRLGPAPTTEKPGWGL